MLAERGNHSMNNGAYPCTFPATESGITGRKRKTMNTQTLVQPLAQPLARSLLQSLALLLLLVGSVVFQQPAHAACPVQEEAGSWVNAWSKANSVARVELSFICQDQIKDGRPYPPGPAWIVQVFGRCEPYDCDWNETAADRLATGHLYAIYDQGFAIRHVYAQMSKFRRDQLWVYTWTDFKDPNRPDYGVHDWFVRK